MRVWAVVHADVGAQCCCKVFMRCLNHFGLKPGSQLVLQAAGARNNLVEDIHLCAGKGQYLVHAREALLHSMQYSL